MVGHYLTVALRSFAWHRLHTAVGIAVLTLGLTCFITTYLSVAYMRGYDRHFANADRTYVVFQGMYGPKSRFSWRSQPWSAMPLADQLVLDVPELAAVARYRTLGRAFVTVDGEQKARRMASVDPKFLEIFDFAVLAGDLEHALAGSNAVITASAADALFGTRDVAGKTVTISGQNSVDVTIAAVIADLPQASHLSSTGLGSSGFEVLLPWDVGERLSPMPMLAEGWFNPNAITYALLPADRSIDARELDRRLAVLVKNHVPDQGVEVYLNARPLAAVATAFMQSQFQGSQGKDWPVDIFTLLRLFGAVVLAVACVNFVNLATARAVGRAREIGVRKALGASRSQVLLQELFGTGSTVVLSVLLAIALFAALPELVPDPWRQAFHLPWTEPWFFAFLAALVIVVTALAGLYPAFVLARARPTAIIGKGTIRAGSKWLRAVLVGSQFAVASFLISAVVVLSEQRGALRDALLGRFTDQYVVVWPAAPGGTGIDPDVLKVELEKFRGVRGVTASSSYPWQFSGGRPTVSLTPGDEQALLSMEQTFVGYDYFAVMEIPLIAGRVFARERNDERPITPQARTGPLAAVIDRKAARALGWSNPSDAVGRTFYYNGKAVNATEIIGVVETVGLAIRDRGSQGMVYAVQPQFAAWTYIRIAKDDVEATLAHVDKVFGELSPERRPRPRQFLDQAFENAYFAFAIANRVFLILGAFAIAIAAVGLVGIASYTTARRTREIGLRKSQGARSIEILGLLLWDFTKPVLVANTLVAPLTFLAARRYLEVFAERTSLSPVPFAIALAGTLVVAWLAVAGRVVPVAHIRPCDALRDE